MNKVCPKCGGLKVVHGLGFMKKTCPVCLGVGYVEIKEDKAADHTHGSILAEPKLASIPVERSELKPVQAKPEGKATDGQAKASSKK